MRLYMNGLFKSRVPSLSWVDRTVLSIRSHCSNSESCGVIFGCRAVFEHAENLNHLVRAIYQEMGLSHLNVWSNADA